MRLEKDEKQLLEALRYYSSILGLCCMCSHIYFEGVLSMNLLICILYTVTFNYGSSSNYHFPHLKTMWKKFKIKTLLNVFGTTLLGILRIVLISMTSNGSDGNVALFISYLQMFISFTDNFTVLCTLERTEIPAPVAPLRRVYPRYAPAG